MFYVYILQDETAGFYIGQTQDIEARVQRHNQGKSVYTKHGWWTLVYSESYHTRSEAVRREREIKAWKSRAKIAELVSRGTAG